MSRLFVAGRPPFFWPAVVWLLAAPWLVFPTLFPAMTIAAVALLVAVFGVAHWRGGRLVRPTGLDGAILLYLAFSLIAFAVSPLPEVSLPKVTMIILGVFGYYLAFAWITFEAKTGPASRTGRLWTLLGLLVAAGAGSTVIGLFTLEWPRRQIFDLQRLTQRLPHLSGDFSLHHNELAGTLLLVMPFAVALIWRPARFWQRAAAALALLFIGLGLLLAQSRGAYLGMAAAVLAWMVWGRVRLRFAGLALVGIIVLGALSLAAAGVEGDDLVLWVAQLDAGSKSGRPDAISWLARLEIWDAAIDVLRDYPIIGSGLYTFEPVSRANYAYELIGAEFNITHTHNLFLEAGTSLGWPGLLTLALLWLTVAYGLWQAALRTTGEWQYLARIFGASVVAYHTFNLFDVLMLGQKPGVLIWLVSAGMAALARLVTPAGVPLKEGRWAGGRGWTIAQLSPLLLLAVLCLTPALPRNLAYLRLDRARLSGAAGKPAADALAGDARRLGLRAYLEGDEAAALAYWRQDPQAALFLLNQGTLAESAGDLEEAIKWFDLSLVIDPTFARAYYERGLAYERSRRPELVLAQADYERAARYARQNGLGAVWQAQSLYNWGRMVAANGDWVAAAGLFERAIDLDPDKFWYYRWLGDALTQLGDESGAAEAYHLADITSQ